MRPFLIPAVGIFARIPRAGQAKTRLSPILGLEGAARLQAALIADTLRKVAALKRCARPYLFLASDSIGRGRISTAAVLPEPCRTLIQTGKFCLVRQQGEDLGERLQNAFRTLLRRHPSCVIIGTDSPLFPARVLGQAFGELRATESVLGPCPDGGYYLVGLRRPADPGLFDEIFQHVRWSTAFTFHDTLGNLLRQGLSCSVLPTYEDVDLPADLQRLKRALSRDRTARRLAPAAWKFLKCASVRPGL